MTNIFTPEPIIYIKQNLQHVFLDWFNNFLTVEKFAEHYGLTEAQAAQVIELGKQIHEAQFSEAA